MVLLVLLQFIVIEIIVFKLLHFYYHSQNVVNL